ncbi:Retrovirus-related Pol polyprotein from transposon [Dictyocoela muelleri]|nr:Retrovirus-related Pol polyprotein from transposon [Dictyocoela muelleri]
MKRTYVFRRMLFGICNAPTIFKTAMNMIFADTGNFIVYMDDIIVYTSSLDQHKNVFKDVFRKMQDNNVSINFDKCKFFETKIEFLSQHTQKRPELHLTYLN